MVVASACPLGARRLSPMFARRPIPAAGPAAAPPAAPLLARLARAVTRPPVAASLASVLFLGAGAGLIAAVGDPHAGAPEVKVALARPKPHRPAASAPPSGLEAFTLDSLGRDQDMAAPGFEAFQDDGPIRGTAVITLPDGGDAPSAPLRRFAPDPLPAAPAQGLTQQGPLGPLPVISPDGRTPFAAYQRPFKSNGQPRVALVVGGLGLNAAATRAAIERLPPEVTLSFVPYADGLQGWIDLARAGGHEVLLEIPMEPKDYPENDPGPYTLLAAAPAPDTVKRLEWLLSRATGYFGVTNYLGETFLGSDTGMNAFLSALRSRGLAFVDDGQARARSGAFARASADQVIDDQLASDAIGARLTALEQAARAHGAALGSGFAYPVTVETAARWADGLKARGLQLAPASAIARR